MALTLKPDDQEIRRYRCDCYHHANQPREAVLVDPVFGHAGAPLNGRLVSAVEAPTHPLLGEFWEVVSFVLDNDQTLSVHVS